MKKLTDAVEARLKEIHNPEQEEEHMKTFTVRLPLEVIEKLDDLTDPLMMKRAEVARMILTNGVEEIIEHLNLKVEKFGVPFSEIYAFENGELDLVEKSSKEEGGQK